MPKPLPSNSPTFVCAHCKCKISPNVTLACNDAGEVYVMNVDTWPTYFWDTLLHRDEFCSAACVLTFLQKPK